MFSVLALGASVFSSCDPKVEAPTPSAGVDLDLSNYIAIGNSLTAGYASNGLYLEGQKVAYPVLIAQQFKLAGGGEFNAPLFEPDQSDGTGYLRLEGFSGSSPILKSVPGSLNAIASKDALAYNSSLNPDSIVLKPYTGPTNHNFGVPGIRVADINTVGYGWPNSYFGRMLTVVEKGTKSYSAKVLEQNPTFFTCWLGNNDVLGYSTAGGAQLIANVTPTAIFSQNYKTFISQLVSQSNKPKGVLANIPDVTSIPFFTTVGPSVKLLLPSAVPAFFEFKFDSVFNKVLAILANPVNPGVTILDTTKGSPVLTNKIATLNPVLGQFEGDVFFTLTFSPYATDLGKPKGTAWKNIIKSVLAQFNLPATLEPVIWAHSGLDTTKPFGFSHRNPVPDVYVLNSTETEFARRTVREYNNIIQSTATENKLAFVDANSFLKDITRGSYFDGISTSASFLSGGVFSLDGVHLTPRGNALAANEFIKAINEKYGSKITVLNPGQFKGVTFP
jgi:hypothetical protein